MAAQSISAGESTTASPLATLLELSFANKLLLSGMKSLVTFAIVLASKGFPAYCTHKRTLISMGSKMRAKVVGASKSFRAQITLECRRMFLNSLSVSTVCACSLVFRICKAEDVVSVRQ